MIEYPQAQGSGPFPLLLFAPGFQYCGLTYLHLLQTWARAGYVVAAVNFPRTECNLGTAADESDVVNQPQDMSYVLSQLLHLSTQSGNPLSGLLNPDQVAAVGHSDGGDTVAALGANTCCMKNVRLKAVAVLSGAALLRPWWPAEWPAFPGKYFSQGAPPMMFVQGSADTINQPSASRYLYQADRANARYYLDLIGADHMTPYAGTNSTERLVARVTLAFFDRYVLGQTGELTTMTKDGNVSGFCHLYSGSQLPPGTGLCLTQGELPGDGAAAPRPAPDVASRAGPGGASLPCLRGHRRMNDIADPVLRPWS
jgi:pimeloyl-ACP methyl ester carboxylesterase